jgi:N utilization substance protein B
MGNRRKGREVALQTLYSLEYFDSESDISPRDTSSVFYEKLLEITNNKNIKSDSQIFEFAEKILIHLLENIDKIDKIIEKNTKNWSFNKIAFLDKSILRIGVYELLFTDTAPPIIINEAIEISKKYCSESSGKFINGILNAVVEGQNENKT